MCLEVTSSEPTLTQQTLGYGVTGNQLHLITVRLGHVGEYLSYRFKFGSFLVNILLVDFVGEDDYTMLVTDLYYLLDTLFIHNLASRIARVDDY